MEYDEEEGVFGRKGFRKVPLSQTKHFIDNLDTDKHNTLGIGGGEPTIFKNFFKVLKYARKKHPDLLLFIVSNGRMFSYEKFTKKLVNSNLEPLRLGIAFYGHNSSIHDKITRVNGSFEETVQGVRNLLKFGIETEIRMIIQKANYKNLIDFAKFVKNNFPEVFRVVFVNMKYTGNAYLNRNKIKVRISDVVPYAEEGVDFLIKEGLNVRLFHFPLCMISKKFWEIAEGVTKNEELTFVDKCDLCKVKARCPMIWTSYLKLFGEKEFQPIE